MKKQQSSLTAEGIAFIRAWETAKPEGERVCDDPLARHFIGPLMWTLASFFNSIKQRSAPGVAEFLIGRCRYIDDYLQARLDEGLEQLVILGAGFDSRACRFAGLRDLPVFEVDHPATQRAKRERLQKALGHLPENVVLAPVDFMVDSLAERLLASGYDRGRRTLFIWEGVTQYLNPGAVDDTLAFVARNSPPCSAIVFDYIYTQALQTREKRPEVRTMERARRISGEGLSFGIPEGTIGEFLGRRGFCDVHNVTADDLKRLYFTGPNAHRPVAPVSAIASARVAPCACEDHRRDAENAEGNEG